MNPKDMQKIGAYAFLVGVLVAVILGLVATYAAPGAVDPNLEGGAVTVLIVLGLAIGFLNISEKEITPFLVAVIALAVIGLAGANLMKLEFVPSLGKLVSTIVGYIVTFVTPAGVVVAIKAIWDMGSSK